MPTLHARQRAPRLAVACAALLFLPIGLRSQTAGPCSKPNPGATRPWSVEPAARTDALAPGSPGLLLALEPTTVTEPLDLGGPLATQFPLVSQRTFSWTSVLYTLDGVNVTDPYQPGRSDAPLNTAGIEEVVVCTGPDLGASRAYGSEVAASVETPQPAWHGEATARGTASFLASDNLPAAATRGLLQQTAKYRGYTDDSVQLGGPAGRRVDWFGAASGRWSAQTVPLAGPGSDLYTRSWMGSAAVRARVTTKDELQFHASGSRVRLSDWGMPAGIEAWVGRRMAPSFTIPGIEGFAGAPENDGFGFFQTVWNHLAGAGTWQLRYAASAADFDTASAAPIGSESRIDLSTGLTNGVTPLANQADRTRQTVAAAYEPAPIQTGKSRHSLAVGAEWETAGIGNLFSAPSNLNLVTAGEAPAFVVVLNTPAASRERIRSFTAHARDVFAACGWLTFDGSLVADPVRGGAIAWNSVSPRAGFALTLGGLRWATIRGSYARLYAPLAGRYLDFANPNSLGGLQYQWLDRNHDGSYQVGEMGALLMAFGGPYSSIDPALRRPHADEFNLGAELSLPRNAFARTWFFRRDDRDRIASVNTGVPASAYNPVTIVDPGPDGLPGTFDDRQFTVYAQQPASFGKDHYLLTNPSGLRTLGEGMAAELGAGWRSYSFHASFMAVKSFGPSNPGNSPTENDPGVIGSLFSDPNTSIYATGRQFFDRAYVGKLQFAGTLPRILGGIEFANTVNYMDGTVFGRRLLVASLPQGPMLVDVTPRGSPEGGNRAEYVLNWNLRLSRTFPLRRGRAQVALDVLNAANTDNRVQEIESSGPSFNQRLPIAVEPARFLRVTVKYAF